MSWMESKVLIHCRCERRYLFEQAEVFDGDGQLLGAGLQKLQFFRGPLAAPGIAEHQQSDRAICCPRPGP